MCGGKICVVSLESQFACLIHSYIGIVRTDFLTEFAYHFLDLDVQIIDIGGFDLFDMFQFFSITELQLTFLTQLFSLYFTVSIILFLDRWMLAVIWVCCLVMIMMTIFMLPGLIGLFAGLDGLALVVVVAEV